VLCHMLSSVSAATMKKTRSKKPEDAPRRPRSAYMFFLGEFREQHKKVR